MASIGELIYPPSYQRLLDRTAASDWGNPDAPGADLRRKQRAGGQAYQEPFSAMTGSGMSIGRNALDIGRDVALQNDRRDTEAGYADSMVPSPVRGALTPAAAPSPTPTAAPESPGFFPGIQKAIAQSEARLRSALGPTGNNDQSSGIGKLTPLQRPQSIAPVNAISAPETPVSNVNFATPDKSAQRIAQWNDFQNFSRDAMNSVRGRKRYTAQMAEKIMDIGQRMQSGWDAEDSANFRASQGNATNLAGIDRNNASANSRQAMQSQTSLTDRAMNNSAHLEGIDRSGQNAMNLEIAKENSPLAKSQIAYQEALANLHNTQAESGKFQPLIGKDETGNPTFMGSFNTRTGQRVMENGSAPYKDGQELTGPDGKRYVVKGGRPVLKG